MTANTSDRINAILANRDFDLLHKEGTLSETKRAYAFWFLNVIDSPLGSEQRKLAKRKLAKLRDALINQHLAVITKVGINNRPNG